MVSDPDATVYVSERRLTTSPSGPPMYHVDPECSNLDQADGVVDMSLAEAEEECRRQAQCCSTLSALEGFD